jgi:hypothetical protein
MLLAITTATVVFSGMCLVGHVDVWGRVVRVSERVTVSQGLLLGFSPRSYMAPGQGEVHACMRASSSGRGPWAARKPCPCPDELGYHIE